MSDCKIYKSQLKHNHITRDIKPFGACPACDNAHVIQKLQRTKEALRVAREAVEFYATKGDVFEQYSLEDDFSEICHGNFCTEVVGKKARESLKQIDEILGEKDE